MPMTLVNKYLGGGVVEEGSREGGGGDALNHRGTNTTGGSVVAFLAVWSRSLHSFLKEEVRELVSHLISHYKLTCYT